ncbi:hypothetical protein tb265_43790 [Gemmatimonadetes bacterium T265]|nr:hypothetical protein tb265_43790 [Gemmatimonadetes bacterium T265]
MVVTRHHPARAHTRRQGAGRARRAEHLALFYCDAGRRLGAGVTLDAMTDDLLHDELAIRKAGVRP